MPSCLLTSETMTAHNLSEAGRHNRDEAHRARRLLDTLINDVLCKADFHGRVTVDVLFKSNRIVGIDTNVNQTTRS